MKTATYYILKYVLNPFRLVSLLFLGIGYIWGSFADWQDEQMNGIFKIFNINLLDKKSDKVGIENTEIGKIIILVLIICLIFLWLDFFKGVL